MNEPQRLVSIGHQRTVMGVEGMGGQHDCGDAGDLSLIHIYQIKNPVVDKLFDEIGPKYKKRAEEKGQRGGYTRIIKMGPRRGDAAEMVILEMVD